MNDLSKAIDGYYVIDTELMGRIFKAAEFSGLELRRSLEDHFTRCGSGKKTEKQQEIASRYAGEIIEITSIIDLLAKEYGFKKTEGE